jgi:hypothetical protein
MPAPQPYRLRPVRIACINQATEDLGFPLEKLTAALQRFYDTCFLPVWGYPVQLYTPKAPAPGDWLFFYMDDADQADALGYHDLTAAGQPVTKVFVKTAKKAGEQVSVTACHELCEMVLDPLVNLWADAPDGTQWAYEACDAVEEDTFIVAGVPMSNFVTPAYFEPFNHPPGTKFDYLGKLNKPFSMSKGGYSVIRTPRGVTKEVFGSKAKKTRFAKEDRRMHRVEERKPARPRRKPRRRTTGKRSR